MQKVIPFIAALIGITISRLLGLSNMVMMFAGGVVGVICGLLPYFMFKNRLPEFAKMSLWVCGVAGLIGGALLAVPTAVVMVIVGHFKSKAALDRETDI